MVLVLVLLTFAAFVGVGLLASRRQQAAAEGPSTDEALCAVPAVAPDVGTTPTYYLHPGHVWVRLTPDGLASVGASDFAANFVGALSGVDVPHEGAILRQGEPAWTLLSARNRQLTQAMPIDGEIVAVNRKFAGGRPPLTNRSQEMDWILQVRPTRLREDLQSLFSGAMAETWKEVAGLRLNAALSPALGRIANDGGVWLANFGDMFDEPVWLAMRQDLFPPQDTPATK